EVLRADDGLAHAHVDAWASSSRVGARRYRQNGRSYRGHQELLHWYITACTRSSTAMPMPMANTLTMMKAQSGRLISPPRYQPRDITHRYNGAYSTRNATAIRHFVLSLTLPPPRRGEGRRSHHSAQQARVHRPSL